jgi:hypothetical protein
MATDSLGRFSMLGLPPGYFKQFSWEPADGVNYNDPDYVELYRTTECGCTLRKEGSKTCS